MPMAIPVNAFARLNVLKIKSNANKSRRQLDAYKTTSAFTRDLMKTVNSVMATVQ